MCQGCAGPWDRDLALLADGLRPSCPVRGEARGPGLGQEGGLHIREKGRGHWLKAGMELGVVHRLSGGRWTGHGGAVAGGPAGRNPVLGHFLSEARGAHSLGLWAWDSSGLGAGSLSTLAGQREPAQPTSSRTEAVVGFPGTGRWAGVCQVGDTLCRDWEGPSL